MTPADIHLLWRAAREAKSTTGIVLALQLADEECVRSGKRPVSETTLTVNKEPANGAA